MSTEYFIQKNTFSEAHGTFSKTGLILGHKAASENIRK
jgi:hypothetical protein